MAEPVASRIAPGNAWASAR